jgi:hypothetical protein
MRFGIDPVFGTDVTAVGATARFGIGYFHSWRVTTRSDANRSPNSHFDGTRLNFGSIRTYYVHNQVRL